MEYRTLGRTGLRVSAVALGCEGFMHKRAEEVKADFDFAIGHGINFVDIYSSNPDLRADIGAALEGRRGEFIIQGHLCTVWENDQYLRTRDPQKSADSFERQLRQLRTDYLDVGMIHYVDAEADLRTVFDGPIIRLAQRLKAEGRIRSIGLSSHNPARARRRTDVLDQSGLRSATRKRERRHAVGRRKLCPHAAQRRSRTRTALRTVRAHGRGHRRDEGLRRRRPA